MNLVSNRRSFHTKVSMLSRMRLPSSVALFGLIHHLPRQQATDTPRHLVIILQQPGGHSSDGTTARTPRGRHASPAAALPAGRPRLSGCFSWREQNLDQPPRPPVTEIRTRHTSQCSERSLRKGKNMAKVLPAPPRQHAAWLLPREDDSP